MILLLTLPLMGCYADQQQQLGRCIFDAENIYPDSTWLSGDARQNYTWFCMAANGFRLNRQQSACEGSVSPKAEAVLFAQCYEPVGKTAYAIHKLEFAFRRSPGK